MNPSWLKGKKVAIVTDWLTTYGGAEKVVKTISDSLPEAPIYTSQYSEKQVDWFKDRDVRTGWLNLFPARLRKVLSVFRAIYFSHLDLSEYDIIISISTAESKGVKTRDDQLHISYLQGPPTQYFWGMYDDYIKNPGFGAFNPIVRFFFKLLANPMRKVDYKYAQRPDFMLANSTYSAAEIKKYYKRSSEVLFPPVDINKFTLQAKKGDYLISTSRQVNWKRLDLAVLAAIETGEELVLVGGGAEHKKLTKLAEGSENIKFIPFQNEAELSKLVGGAKAFIFPSLEPFGIAPIEALSSGTPIIAFNQGGALDYIKEAVNGVFFSEQTVEGVVDGIKKLNKTKFSAKKISQTAQKFSEKNFKLQFESILKEKINENF